MAQEYLIVDAHAHTYATAEIGIQAMGGTSLCGLTGTIPELLEVMKQGQIARTVMVNQLPVGDMLEAAYSRLPSNLTEKERRETEAKIAETMIGRFQRRNAWTCEVARANPSLIPFINVDPIMGADGMRKEITERVHQGARGLKLHPPSQRLYPNDRRLWPMYETAIELGLPVISHSGAFAYPIVYGQPKYFAEVLESFPKLTLVLAHLGGGFWEETVALSQRYPNVSFDCCQTLDESYKEHSLSDAELVSLIQKLGVDRVMFGSDFPWYNPIKNYQRLLRLSLTPTENRALLSENAIRIYKLAL